MLNDPQRLFYNAAQSREIDRLAIADGVPGFELMQRAGSFAFQALTINFPRVRRLCIVCGPGNNGGDGYVVGALALAAGLSVQLISLAPPKSPDAQRAALLFGEAGGQPEVAGALSGADADLVVDAILGSGLDRDLGGVYRQAAETINQLPCPVMSIDVPTGLNADSGAVQGLAITAELTVSFITRKTGLYTGSGRRYSGRIAFDDLAVPAHHYAAVNPAAQQADIAGCHGRLPQRKADANKGSSGQVLIIGGDQSMAGAACLAGHAAYIGGAGLVQVVTQPGNTAAVTACRPELLVHGVASASQLKVLARERRGVVAIGPGLGQSNWSRDLFACCIEHLEPRVLDADALNLLAGEALRRDDWVLTPHPGEAARLLGCAVRDVQNDRLGAAQEISNRYGGVCVLKGSGTIIAGGENIPWLCPAGSASLACAGTGDVLTGLLAGLLAQGMPVESAAVCAVSLHAAAADRVAPDNQAGLLASELFPPLRELRNQP